MVITSIFGTSSDRYRNIICLPRLGGPASPWWACLALVGLLPVKQRRLGYGHS
jgi:hypothetical protein